MCSSHAAQGFPYRISSPVLHLVKLVFLSAVCDQAVSTTATRAVADWQFLIKVRTTGLSF